MYRQTTFIDEHYERPNERPVPTNNHLLRAISWTAVALVSIAVYALAFWLVGKV